MPERFLRAESLRQHVRQEIQDVRAGLRVRLSTFPELSNLFDYSHSTSSAIVIRKTDRVLFEEIRAIKTSTAEAQRGRNQQKRDSSKQRGVMVTSKLQQLEALVSQEILDVQRGTLPRFSRDPELAERLGYHKRHVGSAIPPNLVDERKRLKEELNRLTPSRELAWVIGMLAAGGTVTSKGEIAFGHPDDDLMAVFASRATRVLRTNVPLKTHKFFIKGREYAGKKVRFCNQNVARQLGDLRLINWSTTLTEIHAWILENPDYIWSFIDGYYNKRGSISSETETRQSPIIRIRIGSEKSANLFVEMLTRVGIKRPVIGASHGKTSEVIVAASDDQHLFAENIHPVIQTKELDLQYIRDAPVKKRGGNKKTTPKYSDEELLQEWHRIAELLGHPPSFSELKKLKSRHQTAYSVGPYLRFGNKNYPAARKFIIEQTLSSSAKSQDQ